MSATKTSSRIAENRKARQYYEFQDFLESGLVLTGPEVKSLRAGQISFRDSFVEFKSGEAWLIGLYIAPYKEAALTEQLPERERKLLLHAQQIHAWSKKVEQKGLTVIPVNLYFKHGKIKLEIALAKGKKLHDQRDTLKQRAENRDTERELARAYK